MSSPEKGALRRFFTARPERPIDFVLTWIGICLVPVVAWPIIGMLTGSMSEGFQRVLPTLIGAPIGSGIALAGIWALRSAKKRDSEG
ncbi:hypothetical protein [Brevibacterium sp. XM4083]|uniref:hypothetical protein n=1 Tax=Brevibacterium sp. XM4083 TaxID=2583238 RepID=UPI0011293258|nr:hypothetical protein [Brevibacterium sp. XM4083]MCM1012957.1 hypothetical protein [Brevibacterium sp. XM4083]